MSLWIRLKHHSLRHWWKLLLVLLVVGGAAVIGVQPQLREQAVTLSHRALEWAGIVQHAHDTDQIYWCPMHPQIKRSQPNEVCPICNMALVPFEGSASDQPPDQMLLTARQVQQAGVATAAVVLRELYREIDTTGRLEYDETRLATITSWIHGRSRIEDLQVNVTGSHVERGEQMAAIYNADLILAQEDYLMALKTNTQVGEINVGELLVQSTRRRLEDQGMMSEQIERLAESGAVDSQILIYSPISGTVLTRHVEEGDYVMEGEPLFEVADLTTLWLMADVYEDELSSVRIGQPATVSVPSLPGESFEGTIAFIDPEVRPETRTVRVRIEVDNIEELLKPAMYARVQLRDEAPQVLAVPENAVLWSGQRAVTIVRRGEGVFQPRELRIGRRWLYPVDQGYQPGGMLEFGQERMRFHEVLDGLAPGEEVVTAGAFLLNAEAQFQSVLTKMLPPADQPATLELAVGAELAAGIQDVLDDYFELTTSLTEDRLEPIAAQASTLADSARGLATQARSMNVAGLEQSASQLVEHAESLAADGPSDLHEARIGYGRISRDMFVLLAENGGATLFGREVFAFHCGMAKVGYENWLWWSPETHNPYMGQRMLSCGTAMETLEP